MESTWRPLHCPAHIVAPTPPPRNPGHQSPGVSLGWGGPSHGLWNPKLAGQGSAMCGQGLGSDTSWLRDHRQVP